MRLEHLSSCFHHSLLVNAGVLTTGVCHLSFLFEQPSQVSAVDFG